MRRVPGTIAISLLLLLAPACVDRGSLEDGTAAEDPAGRIAMGRGLYTAYCAACHGSEARGDGPVAPTLKVRPPDLTRIAARRGGRFDATGVAFHIDGRTSVAAHGTREMPVWGRRFDDRNARMMSEEMLLSPDMIRSIVAWLRSVQVEGETP